MNDHQVTEQQLELIKKICDLFNSLPHTDPEAKLTIDYHGLNLVLDYELTTIEPNGSVTYTVKVD
jgi:hypothetical protein